MGRKTPPLVPLEVKINMERTYKKMLVNFDLSLEVLEKMIIDFGKKIWPYRKAFEHFLNIYENKLGERFLVGILPLDVKKRYLEFKEYGGGFYDLRKGGSADFFSYDERMALVRALLEINESIHKHTSQAVLVSDRTGYESCIDGFKIIFNDIERSLAELKSMAEAWRDYSDMAKEISQQILSFEYGLCLLGPPHHYQDILKAPEYYRGRREDLTFRV